MKQIVKTSLAVSTSVVAVVGLVVAPTFQASALTGTSNTTITATVAPALSVSSGASVLFTMTPATFGAVAESNNSNVITVSTNNYTGYNLKLKDSDATLTLTGTHGSIPVSTNTFASPALLATNSWGYGIAGVGTFSGAYSSQTDVTTSTLKYAGILATDVTLKTTSVTANADTTTVWYAAKIDTATATGTDYADTVTYTATTNP